VTGPVEPNNVVSGPGGPPGTGATGQGEPDPSIPADAETQALGADEAEPAQAAPLAQPAPTVQAAQPAPPAQAAQPAPAQAAQRLGGAADGAGPGWPSPSQEHRGDDEGSAPSTASIEDLVADLERTARERDEYLDALRRNQAEFENIRKRMIKQQSDNVDRAAEALIEKLLPVLDACDGAVRHGATEVEPIFAALLGVLEKEGLERIDPAGQPFDPNQHEAVLHEPADDAGSGTVVTDVMRPGYAWKGRIVRAAMVKVKG